MEHTDDFHAIWLQILAAEATPDRIIPWSADREDLIAQMVHSLSTEMSFQVYDGRIREVHRLWLAELPTLLRGMSQLDLLIIRDDGRKVGLRDGDGAFYIYDRMEMPIPSLQLMNES